MGGLKLLTRIASHRWHDARDTERTLGADGLARLQVAVAASERNHSGEIRVCVEAGLPMSYLWRGADARERALMMFGKLRVWDTEQNNGVLIYLLMAERRIEIVADRGLNQHVSPAQWQAVLGEMAGAFQAGQFIAGLESAVATVHSLLCQHFPLAAGAADLNELPDAVVLL